MQESDRKELLYSFWNRWLDMKARIEEAYKQKDPEAAYMMEKAIENYLGMLGSFSHVDTLDLGGSTSLIEPLNGQERLLFIRRKITGYFAYIQLDALYIEAMKKAVSRMAMKR